MKAFQKEESRMKRTSFAAVALAIMTSSGLQAQQPPAAAGQPAQSSATQPASAATAASNDAAFVTQMAIAGLVEVQLGKIATQQGYDPDVKAFGQMMVKDHELANKELAQIASGLALALPKEIDEKHRTLVDRLSNLQDMELDRQYMAAMVQAHEELASLLRARTGDQGTSPAAAGGAAAHAAHTGGASPTTGVAAGTAGTSGQQAITQWAAKTLPVVQQHLQRARDLQQKVGK
jgi:putative membrane protein